MRYKMPLLRLKSTGECFLGDKMIKKIFLAILTLPKKLTQHIAAQLRSIMENLPTLIKILRFQYQGVRTYANTSIV